MTSFHLVIAVAALLTTLGLIMVLSASGVRSYDIDGSAWLIFGKQVLWTLIGLTACYVALRIPVRFLRRTAFAGFAFAIVLLILVLIPGIGTVANPPTAAPAAAAPTRARRRGARCSAPRCARARR